MITLQLMERLFPTKGFDPAKHNLVRHRAALVAALNKFLPKYEIDNYLRICAFLGCCGVETAYFRTTSEYASGAAYDTRTDLGNTRERDGDGEKYKGSGLIQTTGLYNFWRVVVRFVKKLTGKDFSKDEKKYRNFQSYTQSKDYDLLLAEATRLGVNFIEQPQLLRKVIELAVESACIFWEENDLNHYADRGLFKQLNGVVNRGDANKTPLHWTERNELYSLCKRRVAKDISFAPALGPIVSTVIGNSTYTTQINEPATSPASPMEPIVLTPTEPSKDDSFLAAALDKNVSADEARNAARQHLPSLGARVWKFIARPLMWIYAALEAGNIAAWLGIAVVAGIVIYVIYLNRAEIKKAGDAIKNKFLQ